jgi:HSP20 family molecular chaperone IbpA
MFEFVSHFDNDYMIEDAEGATLIRIAIPGVCKEDLEIDAGLSTLDVRLTGNKKFPFLTRRKWHFKHRLGNPEVSARVENGVLCVRLNETLHNKCRVEIE